MKISTEFNSSAIKVGEEKAIELLAKAGFDCWDLSLFEMCNYDWKNKCLKPNNHPFANREYLSFARKLKQVSLDNGISCNQSHAPFPSSCKAIRDLYERSIECTAEAGGKIIIIHPDNNLDAEKNAEMYFELLPIAKSHGVKIATENMWNWDNEKDQATYAACSTPKSFVDHINAVSDESFVACLDIGHAEMRGLGTSAVEHIYALKDSLQALHIHDNDKHHDNHMLPFTMNIDYEPIAKALADINYSGEFTLECDVFLRNYDSTNLLDGLKEMANCAKKLVSMFEKYK